MLYEVITARAAPGGARARPGSPGCEPLPDPRRRVETRIRLHRRTAADARTAAARALRGEVV